jgi:hypothetical protein
VATNPFSEAAYGADLASRFAAPVVATGGGVPAAALASGTPAPALAAPAATLPALPTAGAPVTSFVPPVSGPSNTGNDDAPPPPPPPPADAEPGLLAPVVAIVPQAEPVATIVEAVVAGVPTVESVSAPTSTASVVPVAVAAPGGLSL